MLGACENLVRGGREDFLVEVYGGDKSHIFFRKFAVVNSAR